MDNRRAKEGGHGFVTIHIHKHSAYIYYKPTRYLRSKICV